MNEKFDKFSERARHVLSLSQEEAQRFNHNYIGTEHLLLGLIREVDGVGARALVNMGASLDVVRSDVEFIIGRGDRIVLGEIGLTPRAKKIVELAVDEARRMNHHYIGTEHLLLGIIREGEGIAAGVLEKQGVTLERARAQIVAMLGGPAAAAARPGAPWGLGGLFANRPAQPDHLFSALTLVCRDVSATAAFYVDILGATMFPGQSPQAQAFPGAERVALLPGASPNLSGTLLAFRAASAEEREAQADTGAGAVLLTFLAIDIVSAHQTFAARGATALTDLSEAPGAPGQRQFTLTDPDGRALLFQGEFRQ